ncbi:nuclear transport factor 2 family protein [Halorubrum trapanicum]|uniref:nuclear transport factor 2 family protein n=1 Tax=Halorubrum trapanicum TaxID=29284 RepID=UPI000BBA7B21|nr:nuclear transport factor 2 family protein [Halorubrum trapanicum]
MPSRREGGEAAPPADEEGEAVAPGDSNPAALARAYYDALDAGEYDRLRSLLASDFVQRRPDRTFEGRDRFVAFMRDDRPNTDTTHAVDGVYPAGPGVAVRGRLLDADGEVLFGFVDVFSVDEDDGRLTALETYAAESSAD